MNSAFPEVEIALATYNGARFLPEQLASLAAQRWPALSIIAADDGSTDATDVILSNFTARPLRIVRGPGGRGVRDNFATAIAATRASYVFLSDQDDWWEAEKVPAMMARLREIENRHGPGHPVLVYCDLALVDRNLHPGAGNWFTATSKSSEAHDLTDLVLTGHVPGCAMAVNRALIDIAFPIPDRAYIHDWWLALVAAVRGTIAYVDQPLVHYRQHGSNTLGAASAMSSPGAKLRALLRSPLSGMQRQRELYAAQAHIADGNVAALRSAFGNDMPLSVRHTLDRLSGGSWLQRYRVMRGAHTGVSQIARAGITWYMGK